MRASDIVTWGITLDAIDHKIDELEAMALRCDTADRAGLMRTVKLLRKQAKQSRIKLR